MLTFVTADARTSLSEAPGLPDKQATPRRSASSALRCNSIALSIPGPTTVRLKERMTTTGATLGLTPGGRARADADAEPEKTRETTLAELATALKVDDAVADGV